MHVRLAAAVVLMSAGIVALVSPARDARAAATAPASPAPADEAAAATALERDVVALLAGVDPASDLAKLQRTLAPRLAVTVGRHFAALRPSPKPREVRSADGRFAVVVVADAGPGKPGVDVTYASRDAAILLVVGGRAGARIAKGEVSVGGKAKADAAGGIAIALGGVGGIGGGAGGAAAATGHVAALALGGEGGPGLTGGARGAAGTGSPPVDLAAIVDAAKAWDAAK